MYPSSEPKLFLPIIFIAPAPLPELIVTGKPPALFVPNVLPFVALFITPKVEASNLLLKTILPVPLQF